MKKFTPNNKRPYKPYKKFGGPPKFMGPDPKELHPSKVDNSRNLLASFNGRVVKARFNEDGESLIRRFKRTVESSGVLAELKKREFYKAPSLKKREKKAKAKKRFLKNKARAERFIRKDD